MRDERMTAELPHHVIMEGRSRLSVSGVEDVESFDEQSIVCVTSRGVLVIRGRELRIGKLNTEGGDLNVEGTVDALEYEDTAAPGGGFFSRLFR
ncbi:MAG: sporulation protein YabP [Oscillospiraceae bacterium]|nr:sporulation protein YabP [Oscillospiraceae bacterium]